MLLVLALAAGCAKTGSGEEPTKAPEEATLAPSATDAPADATDVPEVPTDEPTAVPEPTAEPFKDPYAFEILDFDEAMPRAFSFDTIKQNGKVLTDGGVAGYRLEIDDTIDGKDGKTYEVTLRGWVGFEDSEIKKVGYQIDDGPVVFNDNFFETTQQAVKDAGGEYAQRFTVDVPVGTLSGEGHKLESGYYYLNPGASPFSLYYDGPAAAEHAYDGTIGATEYSVKYTLDKSNAQTWTGSDMGAAKVDYYLDLRDGALYVGCVAENVNANDMIQLNFNPGARLDATTGLFISFQGVESCVALWLNGEYIRRYRFANAFHPFHGFSMMSCGHLAEMHTSAIYIVGAREPGIARSMGLKTRATVEEALEDAKRKIVGENPNILALPRTFTTAAVHLCMKNPEENSHFRDDAPAHPCGG